MWSFILTDKNYAHVGEIINASERRVARPLSKLDTASLRVRLDNPLADALLSCEGYVKAYRNGIEQFAGPVVSAEEVADNTKATISVNCVSSGWFMQKRLVGKSPTGRVFGSATDRAAIVATLINELNAETNGEMGLRAGSATSASSVIYTAGPYRPLLEVINELASAVDGFDWRVVPVENFANGVVTGNKIGEFQAAPVLGTSRANAVFEWGTGTKSNIVSYTRSRSREGQANKVYHNVQQGADAPGYPTISAIDAGSISNYKLLEDLAQADLLDSTLRQQFVDEHVRVRRYPREIITFQPGIDPGLTGRLPQFGTDYDLGDAVKARAVFNQRVRFDGLFRVYGVAFEINDLGVERATLTLVEED